MKLNKNKITNFTGALFVLLLITQYQNCSTNAGGGPGALNQSSKAAYQLTYSGGSSPQVSALITGSAQLLPAVPSLTCTWSIVSGSKFIVSGTSFTNVGGACSAPSITSSQQGSYTLNISVASSSGIIATTSGPITFTPVSSGGPTCTCGTAPSCGGSFADSCGNANACSEPSCVGNNLSVAFTSPADSSTVSGVISVAAAITDSVAITNVQFQVDGQNVAYSTPYSLSLDTTTLANGAHTIIVNASDSSNFQASATVSINVLNCIGNYYVYTSNGFNGNGNRPASMSITSEDSSGNITGTMAFSGYPLGFTMINGTCTNSGPYTGTLSFTRSGYGSTQAWSINYGLTLNGPIDEVDFSQDPLRAVSRGLHSTSKIF